MAKCIMDNKLRLSQEAIAGNAIVFLSIYAIVHWLSSDTLVHRYEKLIVVFAVLRILIGFEIILPEKVERVRC